MRHFKSVSLAIAINIVTVLIVLATSRMLTVDCYMCKKAVFTASPVEYHAGPFKDIPALHIHCAKHIAEHSAPNCGLSVGEWLDIRGFDTGSLDNIGMSHITTH